MKAEQIQSIKREDCDCKDCTEGTINPFHHDLVRMGHNLAANLVAMLENHPDEDARYIILVNTKTGERLRVTI